MEKRRKKFFFATKCIFFPPLNKRVNILLQHREGPCLLVAIFNSLVLRGKISIESGIYPSNIIIDIISNVSPHVHHLKKTLNGYIVNPTFKSCFGFKEYPSFLERLDIKMVHAMIPDKEDKHHDIIEKYDYEGMQMKMVDLDSSNSSNDLQKLNKKNKKKKIIDEFKVLQDWNNKIIKQITKTGLKQIKNNINEGETQIFFRNAHFVCIYKYNNHVYSLITCKGPGGPRCVWNSLPDSNGDFSFYDENFTQTLCNPWESNTCVINGERKKIFA